MVINSKNNSQKPNEFGSIFRAIDALVGDLRTKYYQKIGKVDHDAFKPKPKVPKNTLARSKFKNLAAKAINKPAAALQMERLGLKEASGDPKKRGIDGMVPSPEACYDPVAKQEVAWEKMSKEDQLGWKKVMLGLKTVLKIKKQLKPTEVEAFDRKLHEVLGKYFE